MHNRHTIQKQILHVETGDPTAKMGFEHQVRDLFYDALLPKMEVLFDRYAGPHGRIRMEKLAIEVTLPYSRAWEERLCEAVLHELEQSLRSAVRQDPVDPDAGTFVSGSVPSGDTETVFLYFLSNGRFPWYASRWKVSAIKEYFTDAVIRQLRASGSPTDMHHFLGRLVGLLTSHSYALARLMEQFGESFLVAFFSHTAEYKIMERWRGWIASMGMPDARRLTWLALLVSFARTNGKASVADPEVEKELLLSLLQSLSRDSFSSWWNQEKSGPYRNDILQILGKEFDTSGKQTDVKPERKTVEEKPEEEGIYIENAGLVLLHPFLQPLFTELGLFDGAGFVSEALHQRAVLLTQYLVYPGDEFPEDALLLAKVLCGYDPERTLPATLECTEKECQETEEMLQAVIKYWTMNGVAVHTTVDNLRAAFLQRPGKLIRRSDDWLLKVEGMGYDIVVKGLPWGIGMIKHSWMPEMLRVEWT